MLDRFTDDSRKAMAAALKAATEHRHNHIAPEHILLGLLRIRRGRLSAVFGSISGSVGQLRRSLERLLHLLQGSPGERSGLYPFTPKAQLALKRSAAVADAFDEADIQPEHLLLGILGVQSPPLDLVREEFPRLDFETVFELVAMLTSPEENVEEPPSVPPASSIPDVPLHTVLAKPSRHRVEEVGLRERILLLVLAVPTVLAALASPHAAGLVLLVPGAVLLGCALRPRGWN